MTTPANPTTRRRRTHKVSSTNWIQFQILFYGADGYTYLGMSSTDPATGQISSPDSKSIQTFFGAQKSGSTWIHVSEKLFPGPDGHWYRRSTPLTVCFLHFLHLACEACVDASESTDR